MSGVVAAVSAAPVRASLAGVAPAPPVDPIANTTAAASAAPPNANQMNPKGEATPEERDRRDDGERGARVDAEQAGVGERVAGRALQERGDHAECGARHDADHGARQPEVAHDDLVGVARDRRRERPEDDVERHLPRADREAGQRDEHEEREGDRDGDTGRDASDPGPIGRAGRVRHRCGARHPIDHPSSVELGATHAPVAHERHLAAVEAGLAHEEATQGGDGGRLAREPGVAVAIEAVPLGHVPQGRCRAGRPARRRRAPRLPRRRRPCGRRRGRRGGARPSRAPRARGGRRAPAASSRASQRTSTPDGARTSRRSSCAGTSMSAMPVASDGSDSRIEAMAGAAVSSPASRRVSTSPGRQSMPTVRPGLSSSGPMSTISSPGAAVVAHAEAGPASP